MLKNRVDYMLKRRRKIERKKIKSKDQNQKKNLFLYGVYIFLFSFLISAVMTIISQSFMSSSQIYVSFLILFIVIAIGVLFDIIGVAVTTCNPAPFHSMAAKKNKYAVFALKLIKRAPFVATVSQDVVGDISGIVSGALIASIAFSLLITKVVTSSFLLNVLLSAFLAGLTVGAKAICKDIAIRNSKNITFFVAKFLFYIDYYFTFKWIKE